MGFVDKCLSLGRAASLHVLAWGCGLCLVVFSSCEKAYPTASNAPDQEAKVTPATSVAVVPIQPCGLLTPEEVGAAQGAKIESRKASESSDGAFRVAQCFYAATESAKSVNLALTQRNPGNPRRSPKEFWNETFHGETEREGKGEEDEAKRPPRQIDGVGDEAYWMGRDALYVLHHDTFLRLSIGGPASVEGKISIAKALAAKALVHLPAD